MEIFIRVLHKLMCYLGFHHYHDLDEAKDIVKGPPGLKIKGRFCCRCHDLQIDELDMNGKKAKPAKVTRIGN